MARQLCRGLVYTSGQAANDVVGLGGVARGERKKEKRLANANQQRAVQTLWLVSLERKYGTKIDESATLMEVDSLKANRVFLDLLGIWAQAQKTS